jgi:hypothetical protein
MGKNDITMDTMRTRGPSEAYDEGWARIFRNKATQAECAPREALTDEQLDAIWYALPVIRIHNEADRAGMNSQVALRRAFARAILAANKEPK